MQKILTTTLLFAIAAVIASSCGENNPEKQGKKAAEEMCNCLKKEVQKRGGLSEISENTFENIFEKCQDKIDDKYYEDWSGIQKFTSTYEKELEKCKIYKNLNHKFDNEGEDKKGKNTEKFDKKTIKSFLNVKKGDVYVAGQEYNEQGISVAKLWKNGIEQNLSDGKIEGSANSVFVYNEDVYVAGYLGDDAVLWKNGITQRLGIGSALSVFVSEGDVYVAGNEYSAQYKVTLARLWKNGVTQNLTTEGNFYSDAYSVYVFGNDVYVAGSENIKYKGVAKLWKNGVAQNLTNPSNYSSANSVFVSGSDVYVAGSDINEKGVSGGVLWKNGIVQKIIDTGSAGPVFVSGRDVYVLSWDGLWKNGVTVQKNPDYNTSYCDVYIFNSNIYVVGFERSGEEYEDWDGIRKYQVAKLWENGIAQNLSNGTSNAEANSVFVVR